VNPTKIVHIVDDDPAIRDSLATLLKVTGYQYRLYESAEKFLELYNQNLTPCECLVLDLKMPGMGGTELLIQLQSNQTKIPTIILSGHGEAMEFSSSRNESVICFIQKPFQVDELLVTIQKTLTANG